MNDPSQSGPTYPFIVGLMNQLGAQAHGVAAGEAYLTRLKANGLHVYPINGDTLHALETGQLDYGLIQTRRPPASCKRPPGRPASSPRWSTCPSPRCCPA